MSSSISAISSNFDTILDTIRALDRGQISTEAAVKIIKNRASSGLNSARQVEEEMDIAVNTLLKISNGR